MTAPTTTAVLQQVAHTTVSLSTLHQLYLLRHPPPVPMPMLSGGAQPPRPRQPRTANLLLSFYRIPQPVRYFIAGNLGNVVFFLVERLLHFGMVQLLPTDSTTTNNNNKFLDLVAAWADTITFFSAYMLHIPVQHYLYALLVFGLDSINTPSKYWQTLGGTYSALMASSVGSTALNTTLLKWGLSRTTAFVVTLWTFACFNYFVIGWIVNRTRVKDAKRH